MNTAITVQELLAQIITRREQHSETASLEAQLLVAHFLDKPRTWILAHPEVSINQPKLREINRAADRLVDGEPLPYIIGHWEFYGSEFYLTPAVLIPRPETELLVERSLSWLQRNPSRREAVDVGTGSGCIGISLAKLIPDLRMLLTDISPDALDVAKINAKRHGISERIRFIRADLLSGVAGPFDLICANLPYIRSTQLKTLPVAQREPQLALNGGTEGTGLIKRMLEQARNYLLPGGLLTLEIDASQGSEIYALAQSLFPLSEVNTLKDLSNLDRCVEIQRPNLIVHLCTYKAWLEAQKEGSYSASSLMQEGFIHCSQPEQVLEVANRFYRGIHEPVLLWLEPDKLTSEVLWQNVDNVYFSHIYGPINLDAIVSMTELKPEIDGVYRQIQLPR